MIMKYILFIISLFFVSGLSAQKSYKETKTFVGDYDYNSGDKLKISGERTFIYLEVWDHNKVEAQVEVVSRYSNQSQALEDIEKIAVRFEKKGKTIYYNNALNIQSGKGKPKSNLKTILKLYIPKRANIEITNAYGEIHLNGDIGNLQIQSQFTSVHAKSLVAEAEVNVRFGEIEWDNCRGKAKIEANRTNLKIKNPEGVLETKIQYSELDLAYIDKVTNLKIEAEHSPITLLLSEDYNKPCKVECERCNVNIDSCSKIVDEKISGKKHEVYLVDKDKLTGKIVSKHADVTIINTNSYSNSK